MRLFLALLGLITAAGPSAAASPGDGDLKTRLTLRGKLVFSEDFESPEPGGEWNVAKGTWTVADGALRGAELASDDHAAVIKHPVPGNDLVLQFAFRLDGAKRAMVSFDGKGHICRVLLTPTGFMVRSDGTKDKRVKAVVLGKASIDLKPGEWHTMLIEILGKEMLAQVDDRAFAFGENERVAMDKKTFGFPVAGEAFIVDKIRLWEAAPNPDWADSRRTLGRSE